MDQFYFGAQREDALLTSAARKPINGTDQADTLRGGNAADVIHGLGGNDSINGGNGNDQIFGDAGKDRLYGDAGNDTIDGGSSADQLHGGAGNDYLIGGAGNDKLYGETGNDKLQGDAGNDQLYSGGTATLIGGAGNDLLVGGAGVDRFQYDATQKPFDNGHDTLRNFGSNDMIDVFLHITDKNWDQQVSASVTWDSTSNDSVVTISGTGTIQGVLATFTIEDYRFSSQQDLMNQLHIVAQTPGGDVVFG